MLIRETVRMVEVTRVFSSDIGETCPDCQGPTIWTNDHVNDTRWYRQCLDCGNRFEKPDIKIAIGGR